MCGIVGYIGSRDCKELLLRGLEKLEYRGYDSAGIALRTADGGIAVRKEKGRIAALRAAAEEELDGLAGIGHTRWATHGPPSRSNAHPHRSGSGRFTLVHNGVIENYKSLKRDYLPDAAFESDTDSEVIAKLLEVIAEDAPDTVTAFQRTLALLEGSYAIAMIDREQPDTLYAGKNKSPLLIGEGQGEWVVASDAMAMLHVTDRCYELMDGETAVVQRDGAAIHSPEGLPVKRNAFTAKVDAADIEKGPYAHYMLKEMDEQAAVIRRLTAKYRAEDGSIAIDAGIAEALREADRLYLIGCGTSCHAGLVGKQLFERLAGMPVEVHVASEFLYNRPLLSARPVFVFISQSGETADSRGVLTAVGKEGYKTIALTNVPGSTLAREADEALYTHAGPEIAVASTKAYTAQVAVLAVMACCAARVRGREPEIDLFRELGLAANAVEIAIHQKERMEEIVWRYLSTSRNCFFIGRAQDYYVCLEGALKLKEISYIQAEGFAGGELKHGTIALIEEGTPVVALLTESHIRGSIRGNIQEVEARGARVCVISMEGLDEEGDDLVLPRVHPALAPLVAVIPLQFIAYYAALYRGCDVDKPRNLAKSVTVE